VKCGSGWHEWRNYGEVNIVRNDFIVGTLVEEPCFTKFILEKQYLIKEMHLKSKDPRLSLVPIPIVVAAYNA
jgi:hypothetical protein